MQARSARGILARGLARSYGDAAQNAGGHVLDMTGVDRVQRTDLAIGEIEVEAAFPWTGSCNCSYRGDFSSR